MTHLYDQKRQLTNPILKILVVLVAISGIHGAIHLYDKEDWDKYMEMAGDQVVLVAFVATYQPFSADIDLLFIKMNIEYKGTAQFMVVEYTEAEDLMEYLNVEVTPTFWTVKNKKKLEGWEGDIDGLREKLEALIKKYS